jgi:aryl-alcohol dehydrogenase (NADP+)
VGVIPWSPLARGFLARKQVVRNPQTEAETARTRSDSFAHGLYYRDEDFTIAERVIELANQRGVSPGQVALAWLRHQPGIVAPIIGASKMYQLEEAVASLEISLSDDEQRFLEECYRPHPVLGHS